MKHFQKGLIVYGLHNPLTYLRNILCSLTIDRMDPALGKGVIVNSKSKLVKDHV